MTRERHGKAAELRRLPVWDGADDLGRPICRSAGNCFLWATHIACWTQGPAAHGPKRRVEKPVCRKHARTFAESHGLEVP
jgi:hypothetical protein